MAEADVLEVSIVVKVDGEPTASIFHTRQDSAGVPTLPDLYSHVFDAWQANAEDEWANRSGTEAVLDCIKVQRISPTRDPASIFQVNRLGAVVSDCQPAINSCVHSWYSLTVTGRGRGRKFWSGVPKSGVSRNNLITAQFDLEVLFALTFLNDWVETETFQAGIWSPTAGAFSKLSTLIVRPILKNIRSRKPALCV